MIQLTITFIFLLIASITDLKFNKVKNKHILISVILGLIINALTFGLKGLTIAFIGLVIPLIIGYPLFILGLIPAGDIKMFMALGAINGIKSTGSLLIITVLFGGLYSTFLVFKRGDFTGFFKLFKYVKEVTITRELRAYDTEKSIKFPLAPVTLISYLVFIFLVDML